MYTLAMMTIGPFTFPATFFNSALLIVILVIAAIILYFIYKHCKKTDNRLKEIEDTYGYLKFLDDANLKIYKQYLKEKAKNERKKKPRKNA